MTTFRALLCATLVLIISQQIVGQDASGWQFPSFGTFGSGNFGGIQIPSVPGLGSNSSGIFGFPFPFPGFSGLFRQKRQAPLPPPLPPFVVTCDSSRQPRYSCTSCKQSLICLRDNIGVLANCSGLFGYCYNGLCSPIQSSECKS